MFDRAVCCGVVRADLPRVDRTALDRLKVLILEGSGTPTGPMIEARPRSLPLEGEADATPGSPSSFPQFDLFRPATSTLEHIPIRRQSIKTTRSNAWSNSQDAVYGEIEYLDGATGLREVSGT